jgi:hypothetical protein
VVSVGHSPGITRGEPTKTIGHARAGGETKLTVHCLGCYHQAVKTFEELKLWRDMIFVDVPKLSPTRLLEMRKPQREGNADISSSTRRAGLWPLAGVENGICRG